MLPGHQDKTLVQWELSTRPGQDSETVGRYRDTRTRHRDSVKLPGHQNKIAGQWDVSGTPGQYMGIG